MHKIVVFIIMSKSDSFVTFWFIGKKNRIFIKTMTKVRYYKAIKNFDFTGQFQVQKQLSFKVYIVTVK